MKIEFYFHGGSWAVGAVCSAVYFGQLSLWWLALAVPAFLVSFPAFTFKWTRTTS